jgi:hypothetical protein
MDDGFLKVGIPTLEEGNLTLEKYVPVKVNTYSLFWVNYLLTGEMDPESQHYSSSCEGVSQPKKGNAQLYCKSAVPLRKAIVEKRRTNAPLVDIRKMRILTPPSISQEDHPLSIKTNLQRKLLPEARYPG